MKVRLKQAWKKHQAGEIIEVTKNEAFGLIDGGKATVDRMLTPDVYRKKTWRR